MMKAGVLKSTGRGKVVTPIFIPQLKSLIGLINPTTFGSNHIILPSLGHSTGFHMLQGLDSAIIIRIARLGSRTSELGRAGANGCLFGFGFLFCRILRLPAAVVTHGANRAIELRGPKFRAHSCAPGRKLNGEATGPCMGQVYQEQSRESC